MSGETGEKAPSFFIDAQLELMWGVLDRIIPPADNFPGAGDLGVTNYVDRVVGESEDLKRLFARGLTQIATNGEAQGPEGFAGLPDEQKDAVLRQVESEDPEFFQALVRHTYNGYYTNPRIIELLGLEARPPQPKGYQLEPGDLSLLERVKKRGQAYRDD